MFFFILSKQQQQENKLGYENLEIEFNVSIPKSVTRSSRSIFNYGHAKALLSKNFYKVGRHPGHMVFLFLFPILNLSCFFLSLGNELTNIRIGIVNDELGNYTTCEDYLPQNKAGGFLRGYRDCEMTALGCKLIELFGHKLDSQYYKSVEDAFIDAHKGYINTYLHFKENFSGALKTRIEDGISTKADVLDSLEVQVHQDMTSRDLAFTVQREIVNAYNKFVLVIARECNESEHTTQLPLKFNKPIYGHEEMTFNEFMAPGMLITLVLFLTLSATTNILVCERLEGIWERTFVSGVTTAEILIYHTISQIPITLVQTVEILVLAFGVYQLDFVGDLFTVGVLLFLQGMVGTCGGIFISVISRTVTESHFLAIGTVFSTVLFCGCLWPIEGMPVALQIFSIITPSTLAVESTGHILRRGWSFSNYHVYKGFCSCIGYCMIFTICSIVYLRLSK